MSLFDKNKGPIFLKESSNANNQLFTLKEHSKTAQGKQLKQIEQEIKFVKAGILGEKTIKYELQMSHLYVLNAGRSWFEGKPQKVKLRGKNFMDVQSFRSAGVISLLIRIKDSRRFGYNKIVLFKRPLI